MTIDENDLVSNADLIGAGRSLTMINGIVYWTEYKMPYKLVFTPIIGNHVKIIHFLMDAINEAWRVDGSSELQQTLTELLLDQLNSVEKYD